MDYNILQNTPTIQRRGVACNALQCRDCGIRQIKRNIAIPARATGDGRPYKTVLFPSKPYIHHNDKNQYRNSGTGDRGRSPLQNRFVSGGRIG
ncbi:MAG: hypothetical protein FWB85_07345 [Chitinispirillia bacterium]|nr:hypothetical protein [Chitinispirillia bacterium]